jgi:hypothetical protein
MSKCSKAPRRRVKMSENRPFRLFPSAARDPRMPYTAKPLLGFTGCHCPLPVQPNLPAIGHGVGYIDVHDAGSLRIPWSFLGIRNVVGAFAIGRPAQQCTGRSLVKVGGLRRASDKAISNQAPGMVGEGVETGWRASLEDEDTVRLSSKGESDRLTQTSAVQIRPRTHVSGRAPAEMRQFTECRLRLPPSPFLKSFRLSRPSGQNQRPYAIRLAL